MAICCQICRKQLNDNDWIELDYTNKVTHCTCNTLRSNRIKDIDTYKNIKSKYYFFRYEAKELETCAL